MIAFPQLLSGAVAQYPIRKRIITRTAVVSHADGTEGKYPDGGGNSIEWTLPLKALNAEEAGQIESLFASCVGRYGEFVFLDPMDNLLAYSEDIGSEVWIKDPYIAHECNLPGPMGGAAATLVSNSGPVVQRVVQRLRVPSWYRFCFSAYVRSDYPNSISLFGSNGTEKQYTEYATGPDWRRILHRSRLSGTGDAADFGIELAPGSAVEIAGLQVEAQPVPSTYKRTGAQSGVYPRARFDQDQMASEAMGPDCYGYTVRIRAGRQA